MLYDDEEHCRSHADVPAVLHFISTCSSTASSATSETQRQGDGNCGFRHDVQQPHVTCGWSACDQLA